MSMVILKGTLYFVFCSFLFCNAIRPFFLSESEEITMGNKFKAQIVADTIQYPHFRGDKRVCSYIDSLGKLISSAQKDWNNSALTFSFTIIDNDTMINAFAVPGGHVFVYTGLLIAAQNESQVAGVLAHEIGHITKHHSANMLVEQNMIGFANTILFGNDSSAAVAISTLLEGLTFLRFSRGNENEADSLAVSYTALACMNPTGMSQFLSILKSTYGDSPRILEPVENALSSHPSLSDRIKNVDEIIRKSKNADTTLSLKASEYSVIRSLVRK
jgi:beta-barrel assembly-enhancing protease